MGHNPTREEAMRRAMTPKPASKVRAMTSEELRDERRLIHLGYRIRRLPDQLETARAKLARLEAEARELGMHDLLERRA